MAIKAVSEYSDEKGKTLLRCDFDDGSVWSYDQKEQTWVQLRPAFAELQTSFDAK